MKSKLSHKLFITNLAIIFALVALLLVLGYFSSKSLLSDFVMSKDMESIDELAEELSQYYDEKQSWAELAGDSQEWRSITRPLFLSKNRFPPPPPPGGPDKPREFMPSGHLLPPPEGPPPPRGTRPVPPTPFFDRISLLDAEKKVVVQARHRGGSNTLQAIWLNGATVGWLSLEKFKVGADPMAALFMKRQLHLSYWVAIAGILVAALFSYALSRHITSPIKKLTLGAARIAKRDFNVRIDVSTNDELKELTDSFNHIARELRDFQQRQKQWLLDISHELRTPLTILHGELEAMSDGISPCNLQAVASLQEEVLQIKRLVDDLHEISVIDSPGFQCVSQRVEFAELIRHQLQKYQSKLSDRDIELHNTIAIDAKIILMGDPNRLAQVIQNVLENNLRYTESPGSLLVDIKTTATDMRLSFHDSGPGVADDSLEKLFDRLYRTDSSRNRKTGGAGLGLAICKNIISRHNGDITASHSPRGGLCICIRLPIGSSTLGSKRL